MVTRIRNTVATMVMRGLPVVLVAIAIAPVDGNAQAAREATGNLFPSSRLESMESGFFQDAEERRRRAAEKISAGNIKIALSLIYSAGNVGMYWFAMDSNRKAETDPTQPVYDEEKVKLALVVGVAASAVVFIWGIIQRQNGEAEMAATEGLTADLAFGLTPQPAVGVTWTWRP